MDIEQLRKDILKGRDLSLGEHEDLINQKINEFIVYSKKRDHEIINKFKVFLHELENGTVVLKAEDAEDNKISTYVNEEEGAVLVGVSTRTMGKWERSGVFLKSKKIKSPKTGHTGKYWLRSNVLKWVKDNLETIAKAQNRGPGANKEDQDIANFLDKNPDIEDAMAST